MLWLLLPLVCALSLAAGVALQSRRQVHYRRRWSEAVALVYDLREELGSATARAERATLVCEPHTREIAAVTAERDEAREMRDAAAAALREAVELREAAIDARDLMQLEYDAMRRERGSDAGCA